MSWKARIENYESQRNWRRAANVGSACFIFGIILGISAIIVAASGVNGPVQGVIPGSILCSGLILGSFGLILCIWSSSFLKKPRLDDGIELVSLKSSPIIVKDV